MISTTGPAKDRARRGGSPGLGIPTFGGMPGFGVPGVPKLDVPKLDMVHLVRGWRLFRTRLDRRRRLVRWRAWRSERRQRTDVSLRRSIALYQLDHADDQQNRGPGAMEFKASDVLEQQKNTHRDQDRRPHQFAGAATLTLTKSAVGLD